MDESFSEIGGWEQVVMPEHGGVMRSVISTGAPGIIFGALKILREH